MTVGWAGIVRFDANGTLDPTFGVGGLRPMKHSSDMAIQPDGKIVV